MALLDTKEAAIVKFIEKRFEWARVRVQGPMQKDVAETIAIILPSITYPACMCSTFDSACVKEK